ncbi:hypothetical protein B0H14DRAFT_2535188 [Mycena olivaceomarginata]|nr:hypothetical protein B0H14DRAFT_2535188 [Mycena olivaceomarginata]
MSDQELNDQLEAYTQNRNDNPESKHNDGKGIKYIVALQPLSPPVKNGEKRRKNAKVDVISKTIHAHEDDSFAELLDAAITGVGYNGVLKFKIVASDLCADNFSVTWSINRTDFKKMKLTTTGDYDEMVDEAIEKAKPAVRLDMAECSIKSTDNRVNDDDASDDELAITKPKKRKLTEEEEAIAETIAQLKAMYNCSDKQCRSPICYLGNPTAEHTRLTLMHLSTWAAAIV